MTPATNVFIISFPTVDVVFLLKINIKEESHAYYVR